VCMKGTACVCVNVCVFESEAVCEALCV